MDYVQITPQQRREMLKAIGVEAVEDLYSSLPEAYKLKKPLDLPGLARGQSELELQRELASLGAANHPAASAPGGCFMGAGAYDHFIPSSVDFLAGKGEFVTAYTPYQAEASQGSLQAFFEFQSQVCRLTGLDVSNASLYEGATAVAEAVLMSLNHTGRRRVLVASTLHPHYLAVLRTYMSDLPVKLIELQACAKAGHVLPETVRAALEEGKGDTACLVVQSPNVLGQVEDWAGLFALAHESKMSDGSLAGTLAVAVFNPIACGLLKRPGDCGADIAAGEGQPLGVPLQYGGPWLGLFAARQALLRRMPGRLVGQTTDAKGNRGFCLTLQTREQHIRGAKATSNVCTNQGLLALRATIYMSAMGPKGLREVAEHCYHKAHYAAEKAAAVPGYSLAYSGAFFHEFTLSCPVPARKIIDAGRARGLLPGVDCSSLGIGSANQLLVAVTEKRTVEQIDALITLLREVH
ncbi:MAG: aminomethyl-transferring glycine dehydrogenase subunit GcvPA [Planctomycetota bacterium]|nr:aminomethyl-transferring glycine dehydrogenase subunit GcvPA [Planctomycetota bacterium]